MTIYYLPPGFENITTVRLNLKFCQLYKIAAFNRYLPYVILHTYLEFEIKASILILFQPWKTFRDEQPSNFVVQNILQYKYDQIFDPENDPEDPEMKRKSVPIEKLIKSVGTDEQKVTDIYFSILSFIFKISNSDWIFLFSHLNATFSRNF